jgi:hypothetical protein
MNKVLTQPPLGFPAIMGALFGLILCAAVIAVATTQPAFAIPGAPAPSTYTSPFGYQITLPDGWRRSTTLSLTLTGTQKLGHDVFTRRAATDESSQLAAYTESPGPAWQGTVVVEVYQNPKNLSPTVWANTTLLTGWAKGQTVDSAQFAGTTAGRITNGTKYTVVYYVGSAGKMYAVGYHADNPAWIPQGVDRNTLGSIAASFKTVP